MRVGYLGPEGTFTQEAALAAPGSAGLELEPMPTIYDAVMAVHEGRVGLSVVPIENSLEGSVNTTLDVLAFEADDVVIVGEEVLGIHQSLIAQEPIALEEIEVVISHPQANAQCARFIRESLPQARVMTSSSTAEAVKLVSERIRHRWAAIGTALAAELYNCTVLQAQIEDLTGNQTRFVWLGPAGSAPGIPGAETSWPAGTGASSANGEAAPTPGWKSSIVFWGAGTDAPGWLVSCLAELSSRNVNLTRIESRPLRQGLGQYMFFADLEGHTDDPHFADALRALRAHVEVLRVLGSYPSA